MNLSRWVVFVLLTAELGAADLTINLRSRVEAFKGSGEWSEASLPMSLPTEKTAVIICDMWDKHWCRGASERCDALAARMAPVVADRSEERRVGKECRSRWSPYH